MPTGVYTRTKVIGRVLQTKNFVNECDCGEIKTQTMWKEYEMGSEKKTGYDFMGSFCKCGNIIISQLPQQEEYKS